MSQDVIELGPFATLAIFDLGFVHAHRRVEEIFEERPNGAMLIANPLILPEPKYARYDTVDHLIESVTRFRDEVVCWATGVGDPEPKYLMTALSKLWLSWVFGVPSGEVPAWALPFGVTRYEGGYPEVFGSARLVAAYSGAAEEDDRRFAEAMLRNIKRDASNQREEVRRLTEPKVNFLTPAVLERIETVREVGTIPSILDSVRSMDLQFDL
jgi:hypothetical protein